MANKETNEELKQQLRAELITLHAHFRDSQMARELEKILKKQEELILGEQISQCVRFDVPDATFRKFAVQLQTIKTVRKLIYDTETFVARASE